MAGVMKLAKSKAQLLENPSMGWTEDFPPPVLKLIGLAEVAGAAGLILPGALDAARWLLPAAAIGLACLMIGAGLTHLRRKEYPNVLLNLGLLALAVLVATERIGAESF
jgi:DoxX-like family